MNYSGNMPDWHQYNSAQPIGSEVPSVGQNVTHSPIFGPSISPRRLNGPSFSPEGLNKPQNEINFNHRNFQQSPNTLNGPNVPSENSPMGSAAQMSGCHGHYGAPSSRNTMIEGTGAPLESRNISGSSLNEAIGQRNHQISMNRSAGHLNSPTINGSMGPMGQRNVPTSLQGPIPTSSRQGPGSYMACKGPCCNPDTNMSYQSWEKFGPYPPTMQYRETGYPPVDNRRFGNDFENREQLSTGAYNIDPRRNFPDYKYRKESVISRPYAHPPGVIQSYPIQNYNFPPDYQKYPVYPVKEYPRDNSIANPQNPGVLKYQEQSVTVQQKYFTKQIQYQNGVIPKSVIPANMGGNVISRAQNPYFNPQLARDFPRGYSDSTPLPNRGIQTGNPIHATYPQYQMYQQKIAMQRFSMENHLRELTQIPGYQSHPKYQESVLRYRELLRLQQTVDYQSTVQDAPKVVTSQVNAEIPPINLQFDQNGVLINSSFAPAVFPNTQTPLNVQSSKNSQSGSNPEVGPQNLQRSEQFKPQDSVENHPQSQNSSSLSQTELSHENEHRYSIEKDQSQVQKYENENLNVANTDDGKTVSMHQRNSRDFADKPELDVRQFLANWDESEDEDGANANLPDVVLSNSTSGVVVEYENTKAASEKLEEPENCSETETDCCSRDDCEMFDNIQNETKPRNSTDDQIYHCDLPPDGESAKSMEHDLDISVSEKKPVRTGTVIQSTSTDCANETALHVIENFANGLTEHDGIKPACQGRESLSNNENRDLLDTVNDNILIKKETAVEEETITSIKEHIEAYNYEANKKIRSSIEEVIGNDDDSSSSYKKESSEDEKHHFGSNEDLSESGDSNSMDSHSISSFMNSPKTIKGTEIHVDAQELSASPISSKSNTQIVENTNLQKQHSFASEESHNPDDISLPDLPTSECTPISTTLNTPIHSDSEESSEPVIDLTTPANPIEIIQNSPMLSFTHSPIKMEPYEHLDENDLADKNSHDALDFEFQTSNSCDNDYEKLTDVSSQTTEQYNISQNDEDTFDSDCVEILSEKVGQKIEGDTLEKKSKIDVIRDITDQNRFTCNNENIMAANKANNTTVNVGHQPWPSVTVREHEHQISNNTEHYDAKSDKSGTLSEVKDRSSIMSEVTKDHSNDDIAADSGAKDCHGINRWPTKSEMHNIRCESPDNVTALNLVKGENKTKSDLIKTTVQIPDKTEDSQVIPKRSTFHTPNLDAAMGLKRINHGECNSSMENQVLFTPTEHPIAYTSRTEEDKIYTENIENQSTFAGSLNIPLIPGEDFEEPKMPVLPMEGNCLTTIIKNTSPITDLDVLGSDDEKLDKMDEIWMEVGSVETVAKVAEANIDTYTECGESSNQEKCFPARNKLRTLQKNNWKCLKNSIKPKDASKLFGNMWNDGKERDLKSSAEKNVQQFTCSSSETVRKEAEPVHKNRESAIISETDRTAAILQAKCDSGKVPIISKRKSNSTFREDARPSHDVCLENNTTEIMKCKEKADHINDIATKLLENARLFEPELRKMEVQRMNLNYGESSRDNSKKRIKLLKEFRKVKNKINVNRPGIESAKSVDTLESDAASSIEIEEQGKKMNTETIKVDNKMIENQDAHTYKRTENLLSKSESLITNSRSTVDCQVVQQLNETTVDVSTNIVIPEEKQREVLNDCEADLTNEDTSRNNCRIVNKGESITVEDSSNVNSHKTSNTKVVSPIEEDINECAINLSKSSNDFDLLETLHEKGCATNDRHSSYISDHINIEEPIEIEGETNTETTCTEKEDCSPIASQSLCTDATASCIEIVKENDKSLEINQPELDNTAEAEGNYECSSTSDYITTSKHCILKENTKPKRDEEPIRHINLGIPEKLSSNPESIGDSVESCRNLEKIGDSIYENSEHSAMVVETNDNEMEMCVLGESGLSNSNGLVAAYDKDNQKPVNETIDSEISFDSKNVRCLVVDISTSKNEDVIKLIANFDDSGQKPLSNHIPVEEIPIEVPENRSQSTSDVSQEKVAESIEDCIGPTLVSHEEKNIGKLSNTTESMESELTSVNDCSLNIENNLQDTDEMFEIHKKSKTVHENLQISEKSLISNESLIQTQSAEFSNTESLQNTNLELLSVTDRSSNTVDASLEAFGFENSANYDFNNFDVAPNISNSEDIEQNNGWKYSRAHARFEDCERYKNPDNSIDPILSSFETLDNLNTVPIYTTKDGKITYSPNPRFTYRALIMEAREREGYPTIREPYYENSRTQESLHYSKHQASFRKRKSSEGYSCSGNYGKKNYSDYYEPREHGESSMKSLPEPWNRNHFIHKKYSHQLRDRNSHFTPHNGDSEKKYSVEKIAREKDSGNCKHREGSMVYEQYNKRKNGTSDNFKGSNRQQYKQLNEQSASDSVWSTSKQDLKREQTFSAAVLPRSETNKLTYNKKSKNLGNNISTEKYSNNINKDNQLKDFQWTQNFTSASEENKRTNDSVENILPMKAELGMSSDKLFEGEKLPDSKIDECGSSSRETEDKPPNDQNLLKILNTEANKGSIVKSGLFCSEWEDSSENLAVLQNNSSKMEIPTEPFLDEVKEVCDKDIKVNDLYDGVDDIYEGNSSSIHVIKQNIDADRLDDKFVISLNSVEAAIIDESLEDPDCNQEKLIIESDETTITNVENKYPSCSEPVQLIQIDKESDEQKIPEILETPNKSEPATSLNVETESTREKDKFDEPVHCKDDQSINVLEPNSTEKCSPAMKDIEHKNFEKEKLHANKPNKFDSLNQISEAEVNLVPLKSSDQISHTLEDTCSLQETVKIDKKELKIKSYKMKSENLNGTSMKNVQLVSNNNVSLKMTLEYETTSKPQTQFENYIAYSPLNESVEDSKVIPKLVIKKTDSLNSKNVCLVPPMTTSHDLFAEKVSDKDEPGKVSIHPKIPKILIRNAKSRPSTPSIEEITEETTFSVTTKEDSKSPKVKIRFEEKRPRSTSISSTENCPKTDAMESKIPKMKIKLEDRLPKVFIENINAESSQPIEVIQKTIPKMKIKKFKGALRQIVDTQILPVSIPRMFIYTECESEKETSLETLTKMEGSASDKNRKSVTPTTIHGDEKITRDTELKKIPKLKIKRQSSGCSVQLNRKRHNTSPIQSELKKVKKSLKLAEPNDKKQSHKLSGHLEYQDSQQKLDGFSVEQSYEIASSENVKYTTEDQSGIQTKSTAGNISGAPEEIPKVIIKRASPSAEFKCELSKGRREALIKNKRWQPEVKLQRSWVLDCMAKDLNLDKLTLKLVTPDSILKKGLTQQKLEVGGTNVKNANINRIEKKLFRSKSTSDLVPVDGNIMFPEDHVKQQNERNARDLPRELINRKRCKSDLGSTFSKYSKNLECNKKLKHNSHLSITQLTLKLTPTHANSTANSSNTQSVKEANIAVAEYQIMKDLKTSLKTSEKSPDETLDENMNSKNEMSTPKINQLNISPRKEETGSTSMTNNCECFENGNENSNTFMDDLKKDRTHDVNDSDLHYSTTKRSDKSEVLKDSVIMKNTDVDSVKRHTTLEKKRTKQIRSKDIEKNGGTNCSLDKNVNLKNNGTFFANNIPTDLTDEERLVELSSTLAVIDNTNVPTEPLILQTVFSMRQDINILKNNSELCYSGISNTLDNIETITCKNKVHKLDINDNSKGNAWTAEDNNTLINNISCVNVAEQKNTSTLNGNAVITSVTSNSESTDLDATDIHDPKIDINLQNSLHNAIDSGGDSMPQIKSSEERQRILEILSTSPSLNQSEAEIHSCPAVIEENGMCLYHEDAIPTQFELELEIIDNTVSDPLQVPIPHDDYAIEESRIYSGVEEKEDSRQSSKGSNNSGCSMNFDDSKSETPLPEENEADSSQVYSVETYRREAFVNPDKQDKILTADIDKRNIGFDVNIKKSFSHSDLLVKEVLAAKETLRKCLVSGKNVIRFKPKARPKTAAEKKQGSSFDLSTLATCDESFTNLEDHSSMGIICSKLLDNREKPCQNETKTEFKVNKVKSERKHSKSGKKDLLKKKNSSLSTSIQKYTNLTEIEGRLIPKRSPIEIKDSVEFTEGETSISLKNSKHLMKNYSYSDSRKTIPELINSKDDKSRSKSSRHDVNWKYSGKSKSALPNIVVHESSLDIGECEEKSVSDAAKHKYKSLKASMDQNVNLLTDKTKFKFYKIPKIKKPVHPESLRFPEKLRELQSKEARMPILEPQVDLNLGVEVSELSSDRETSRSPPLITNQESRAGCEMTITSLDSQTPLSKERKVLSSQRPAFSEAELPEAVPSNNKVTTVADIVNDMAYHEKATIRHRRYCTLCERWFPTVAKHRRHLSGYQHRHTELTQRRTIHALFTLFTGKPCPRLQPPSVARIDCEPGELTPLQIAVQGVTKESNKVDGNITKPTREDK